MKLSSIQLRNWKSFTDLHVELPGDADCPGIAIIEGRNGFGKTSLFEAITLGLYGREGLPLVARAGREGRSDVGYDAFLERALHRGARGEDATASVEMIFDGEPGHRIILQRVWYFSAAGRHRQADEEVRIWHGEDEELLRLPDGEDYAASLREVIARELLPLRLAPFFLFDGEHLDRLAGADLDTQVRLALESALGVPLLRTLEADLRQFARDRRRQHRGGDNERLDHLVALVGELEGKVQQGLDTLGKIGLELEPLRKRRDETVTRIGALHGDSYASFKQLFEQREQLVRKRDLLQEGLRQKLSFDLALSLAGADLRGRTRGRLAAEGDAEQQKMSRAVGARHQERLLALLSAPEERDRIGLDEVQWQRLEDRLQVAWEAAWTESTGSDRPLLHDYLGSADRIVVDRRLQDIEGMAGDAIANAAREAEAADRMLSEIDAQIADQRGADDISQRLADELREVQDQISALEEQSREVGRALEALRGDMSARRAELGRVRADVLASSPVLAKAGYAETVADGLNALVQRLVPLKLEAFAADVTRAYRAMAHKRDVDEVRIGIDGRVSLIGADGTDMRELDPSAGESQLFAFSLMAAIVTASKPFPILLDTPLARLDPEHRDNVLSFFASLDRQIIFLSQPAELTERHIAPLRPRLTRTISLDYGDGRSVARSEDPVHPLDRAVSA